MAWQKASGYNRRAKVEAAIGRRKQVIGGGLRSRMDECPASEVNVAADVLNRMLQLARTMPASSDPNRDWDRCVDTFDPCTTLAPGSWLDAV
jgi:hypothetical protein